jgi:cell wall assembly regulator SMI1
MKDVWDRIHEALRQCAPDVLDSLRPGATDEQIRAAERKMGVILPADVKACYRVHDGAELSIVGEPAYVMFGWGWGSLERVCLNWRGMRELHEEFLGLEEFVSTSDGTVRTEWWHPAWIPLTEFNGNHHCLDLAPEPGGAIGQIILWRNYDNNRVVVARSLTEWLNALAADLEAGFWRSDDHGGLMDADTE